MRTRSPGGYASPRTFLATTKSAASMPRSTTAVAAIAAATTVFERASLRAVVAAGAGLRRTRARRIADQNTVMTTAYTTVQMIRNAHHSVATAAASDPAGVSTS